MMRSKKIQYRELHLGEARLKFDCQLHPKRKVKVVARESLLASESFGTRFIFWIFMTNQKEKILMMQI
jgi:hypothetical protein